MASEPRRVLVVGGGAAGVVTAAALLREAGAAPLAVTVVERAPVVGPGLAYGTRDPHHLLNNYASRMSAVDDDPQHLVRWCLAQGMAVGADTFVSRETYGRYLADLLDSEPVPAGSSLERVRDEVVDLADTGQHLPRHARVRCRADRRPRRPGARQPAAAPAARPRRGGRALRTGPLGPRPARAGRPRGPGAAGRHRPDHRRRRRADRRGPPGRPAHRDLAARAAAAAPPARDARGGARVRRRRPIAAGGAARGPAVHRRRRRLALPGRVAQGDRQRRVALAVLRGQGAVHPARRDGTGRSPGTGWPRRWPRSSTTCSPPGG